MVLISWNENLVALLKLYVLRLVWCLPGAASDQANEILFANYTDIELNDSSSSSPTYHSLELPTKDTKITVGYTLIPLIRNDDPNVIYWPTIDYYPAVLSVFQISRPKVVNGGNRTTICWEILRNPKNKTSTGSNIEIANSIWEIEWNLPRRENHRIDLISLEGNVYHHPLFGLDECTEYQGRVTWNSKVKSWPVSFNTSTPNFNVRNLTAVVNEFDIQLRWLIPPCSYPDAYFKLILNGQHIGGRLHVDTRSYRIYDLQRNSQYNVTLQSCYRDSCRSTERILRTTVTHLDYIRTSSVDLNSRISVSCSTPENVDFFVLYIVDQNNFTINETRSNCQFFDISIGTNSTVYLAAGIQKADGVILSPKTQLQLPHYSYVTWWWLVIFLLVILIILAIPILVRWNRKRRRRLYRTMDVILPIELKLFTNS